MTSRLLSANNPESGTISYVYDQDTNCPTPNSFPGQFVSKTDARGSRTCMQYDYLNRLTQKNYPGSTTPTVTYSYDSTSCLDVSPCYNFNRRTGMVDGAGQTNWSYDAVGNVLEEKRTIGTVTKNIFYTYNLDGSIRTIQYPSGRIITYQPGDAQRPLSVIDSASINYATSAHYAPQGALGSIQNGASLVSTLYYNSRVQPCRASVKSAGTVPSSCSDSANTGNVLDYSYNFNLGSADNGNVIGITNNLTKNTPSMDRSQSFTYDTLNRIATAKTVATSGTNCWGEQYGYDALGNLLSIAGITPQYAGCTQESGLSIAVNGNNQIAGFCYDAVGNLLAQSAPPCPVPAYTYNAENQLTSTAGVTYTYDGDGRRVKKSNGKLYWYGIGGDVLDESDISGNITDEFVFFGGKRIARRNISSGNIYYYFADHLGTARVITNATGTVLDDSDFYPFGGERIVSAASGNHYKFTGKERDSESGLDDFGARFYSSQYGRFMIPDWAAKATAVPYADFGNPQSLNLYSYVENNPLAKADPDGHCALCASIWNFFTGADTPPPPPPPHAPPAMTMLTPMQPPQSQSTTSKAIQTARNTFKKVEKAHAAVQDWVANHPAVQLGIIVLGLVAGGGEGVEGEGAAAGESVEGLQYSERVNARSAEDPGPSHNFPSSFDSEIMKNGQKTAGSDGYLQYNMRGSVNGKEGTYEIGIKGGQIEHRFFRPDP